MDCLTCALPKSTSTTLYSAVLCLCLVQAVGAAAPDDHWDVALKGVPGVTSADCQRTGQGWMPTEQEAAHYTLQSLGDHLERRNVLLGRLRWGNFGQTAPTVEADLMLTGKMEPFRVRFHLYVPQDVDDLVVRTRMEMKQVSASRHSLPVLRLVELPTGQETPLSHCLD